MLIERVRASFPAKFDIHSPVDWATPPGALSRPVPPAFEIGVVGEPGQREQLDFLLLRAVRQLLQSAEPLLLCCGHTAAALPSVPGAPITDERPAHQQHRGNPVTVRQAKPARQVSAIGMPNQHGLGHIPCVEQLGEIVDMPGEGMAPLPRRPARAALVVPVHGSKVRDQGGNIAQVVRQTRTAMEHDHRRPPGGVSQCYPAQLRLVRHRHDALRLHPGHRGEPTGLREALPKVK